MLRLFTIIFADGTIFFFKSVGLTNKKSREQEQRMPRHFKISLLPKELKRIALFLDVDGTLYEIEKSPSLVRPSFKLQKNFT